MVFFFDKLCKNEKTNDIKSESNLLSGKKKPKNNAPLILTF